MLARVIAAAAAVLVVSPSLAVDEPLTPARIVGAGPNNGDVLLGALKLGKRQGGVFSVTAPVAGPIDAATVGGTAISAILGSKAPIASPTFSGTVTAPAFAGDGSDISIRRSGGILRPLSSVVGERLSVLDKGADLTGMTDSAAAFQAAVNSVPSGSAVELTVPPGTWRLDSDVSDNGRVVSWQVSPGATFSGIGRLGLYQIPQYSGAGYDKRNAARWIERGTAAAPLNDETALDTVVKRSALTSLRGSHNAARLSVAERLSGSTAYGQANMALAIDYAGGHGPNSFLEAHRGVAILKGGTGGSPYGGVSAAYADPGTSPTYVIGHEADVSAYDGTSAPNPEAFNKDHFRAAFLASTLYPSADRPDAAYAVNPYNRVTFRTGFYIGKDSTDHTGLYNAASLDAFLFNGGTAYTGVIVGNVTGQAILMRNGIGSLIRVRNGADTADLNVFYVDSGNILQLGTDASAIVTAAPLTTAAVGFNGASPVGKCSLSAALPTDGSATNAAIASAVNAIRSCLVTNGLGQ